MRVNAGTTDRLDRPLSELRVSVTDRCNLRCRYCMPADQPVTFLPRDELLSFEEITRLVRVFVERFGVRKLRLTGGEPLLRRDIERLVESLARIEGLADLALTTNGLRLADMADRLVAAGLQRVTVSLDALDRPTFTKTCGIDADPRAVVEGIDAAAAAGLTPIKINCVVQRGLNEHAVPELAERFRGTPHVVRFIEYMDVGTLNDWRRDAVVSGDEIIERLSAVAPLEAIPRGPSDVSERYAWADGAGEVGVIASVTRPFCKGCTRARLSADGRLLTCLFAAGGTNVRDTLRATDDDATVAHLIDGAWRARDDRYSERRASGGHTQRRLEMYQLGG